MKFDDVDDLVIGLVAGAIADAVRSRSRTALVVAAVVAAAAVVGIAALGTLGRVVCVLVLLVAAGAALLIIVARRIVVGLLDRGVDTTRLADRRASLDTAIDDLDIPTGPVSLVRFAWRLRRGAGAEVDRVAAIARRLQADLDLGNPPTT